jgi:hypothetical protein
MSTKCPRDWARFVDEESNSVESKERDENIAGDKSKANNNCIIEGTGMINL